MCHHVLSTRLTQLLNYRKFEHNGRWPQTAPLHAILNCCTCRPPRPYFEVYSEQKTENNSTAHFLLCCTSRGNPPDLSIHHIFRSMTIHEAVHPSGCINTKLQPAVLMHPPLYCVPKSSPTVMATQVGATSHMLFWQANGTHFVTVVGVL